MAYIDTVHVGDESYEIKGITEIDDSNVSKEKTWSSVATLDRFGCRENLVGERVEFSAIKDTPIKVLAHITAQQNGSGSPSPENPRDIYGWNEITIQHGNTVEDAPHRQMFDDYVFGGTFNTDGELFITHDMKTFNGTENWTKKSLPNGRVDYIYMLKDPSISASSDTTTQLCNIFNTNPTESLSFNYNGVWVIGDTVYVGVPIASKYADVSNWKAFLQSNNMQLLYERETMSGKKYPPVTIKAYEGNNFIQSSTGISDIDCYSKVCPTELKAVDDVATEALTKATENATAIRENSTRIDGLDTRVNKLETAPRNILHHRRTGTIISERDVYAAKPLELVTQGKTQVNLCPVFDTGIPFGVTMKSNNDSSVKVTGTPTQGYANMSKQIKLRPSTTYSYSCVGTVGNSVNSAGAVYTYIDIKETEGGQNVSRKCWEGKTITFTTPATIYDAKIGITTGSDTTTERNTTIYPMLVEGSTPQPWTPSGITSINELRYQVRGKNLLGMHTVADSATFGQCEKTDNGVRLFGSQEGQDAYTTSPIGASEVPPSQRYQLISALPKTEYTFSFSASIGADIVCYFEAWDKNFRAIPRSLWSVLRNSAQSENVNITVRTPEETKYLSARFGLRTSSKIRDVTFSDIQIELGSVATPYEPYTATTTPIDLQGHELCSLPDGTHDEVVSTADGSRIEKIAASIKVDDPSRFAGYYTSGNRSFINYRLPDGWRNTIDTVFCDTYPTAGNTSVAHNKNVLTFKCEPIKAEQEMKDWIIGLAPTVVYAAAPQTIPLPPVDLPTLPAPTANVWSETNVPETTTEVDYERDINIVVDDLAQAITAIPANL